MRAAVGLEQEGHQDAWDQMVELAEQGMVPWLKCSGGEAHFSSSGLRAALTATAIKMGLDAGH